MLALVRVQCVGACVLVRVWGANAGAGVGIESRVRARRGLKVPGAGAESWLRAREVGVECMYWRGRMGVCVCVCVCASACVQALALAPRI
jgi:hypothetical protein